MKTDFKRTIGSYTARRGRFEIVTVPTIQYLMVDGRGDPNTSPAYADALSTIFPMAYALKAISRQQFDRDYVVMPLEALWWAEDMRAFTSVRDKSRWNWTVMIMTPDWLDIEHVDSASATVRRKGAAAALDGLRLESLDEGLVVQTLHIGSYDDEGPVLDALHREVTASPSLHLTGRHHEIYLSDARRTTPAKLRTILRQPVRRAGSA